MIDKSLIEEDWVREAVDAVDGLCVDGKIKLVKNYTLTLHKTQGDLRL